MAFNKDNYHSSVLDALNKAAHTAKDHDSRYVEPLHVAYALVKHAYSGIRQTIDKIGCSPLDLSSAFTDGIKALDKRLDNVPRAEFSMDIFKLFERARRAKQLFPDDEVTPLVLLYCLSFDQSILVHIEKCNTSAQRLRDALIQTFWQNPTRDLVKDCDVNSVAISMMLTADDGDAKPMVGRDDVIQQMTQILRSLEKPNVILTGPPGTGKTAIVQALADKIGHGQFPELGKVAMISLNISKIVAGHCYVGQFEKKLKEFLDTLQSSSTRTIVFIDEIHTVINTNSIKGGISLPDLLKPILTGRKISVIGATTDKEYSQHFETDMAFARRFQRVRVSEPNINETIEILRGTKDKYERHHGVSIQDSALVAAVKLSDRYIKDRSFPDKALYVIDQAMSSQSTLASAIAMNRKRALGSDHTVAPDDCDHAAKRRALDSGDGIADEGCSQDLSAVEIGVGLVEYIAGRTKYSDPDASEFYKTTSIPKLIDHIANNGGWSLVLYNPDSANAAAAAAAAEKPGKKHENVVTAEHISKVIAQLTGIPIERMAEPETSSVLTLGERLRKAVIGQSHAVDAISRVILKSRAGLSSATKPIGTFAFLGLTGTGKTELAKALCRDLFGSLKPLIRLDMSEYMSSHVVSRLIGSSPGYINSQDGGQLTEAVRKQPYSVVLFDEIEKAHPDVLNILLQILDDARLTDGLGRVADFSNCVVILTSNIGQEHLAKAIRMQSIEATREKVVASFKQAVRPELVNRLDEIIVFNPLRPCVLKHIVQLRVGEIGQRLADRNITIDADDEAIEFVLTKSYNPLFGARPIGRFLEQHLVSELARLIVKGEITNGSAVTVRCKDGKLNIQAAIVNELDSDGGSDGSRTLCE